MQTQKTRDEFRTMVQSLSSEITVEVTMQGDAKVRKTGNPFPIVSKVQTLSGAIGKIDYGAHVQSQMAIEGVQGTFTAQSHKWAQHVGNLLQNPKTGEWYLPIITTGTVGKPMYFSETGTLLDYETQVKPYLPEKDEGKNQPTAVKQIYRQVKLENIKEVTIVNGEQHIKLV